MLPTDPIVAVSSPPGRSHRGLVRATGEGVAQILDDLFTPAPKPHELTPTRLHLKAPGRLSGGALPCLALYHPAPRSFTSQDTLEIQLPGNPALLDRVTARLLESLRRITQRGRLAEPGEFTQRAFFAGRIDLTRAEGIAATIAAVSDAQLHAAGLLRSGRLGEWATSLVDRLATLLALVEAGIDFVDQDGVVPISPADLAAGLGGVEAELSQMLGRSRSWASLEALPWVVLVGAPNAGKSTLFNTLLGRRRAVVSDFAGTTRDILTEPLKIEAPGHASAEVMLVDVAGLDSARGLIDHAMQQQARTAIDRAELLVLLHEAGTDPLPPPRCGVPTIHVMSKADRPPGSTFRDPRSEFRVSTKTGEGVAELRRKIAEAMRDRGVSVAGEMMALQNRHRDELAAALESLRAARQLVQVGSGAELIAASIRGGLDHLAALGGVMSPDDVIGKIFATFCVGK